MKQLIVFTFLITLAISANAAELKVRLELGHQAATAPYYVKLFASGPGTSLRAAEGNTQGFVWRGQAGSGVVKRLEFVLVYPDDPNPAKLPFQDVWQRVLKEDDQDTQIRLKNDPSILKERHMVTVQLNEEGTQGFSVDASQLVREKTIWVPALDVYLDAGLTETKWADHQKELAGFHGQRILQRVEHDPEASFAEWSQKWDDMGHPGTEHHAHASVLAWDSSVVKFAIERNGTVRQDNASPGVDLHYDLSDNSTGRVPWVTQRLTNGLPVITTVWQSAKIRYELEQFAFPLEGPPTNRNGEIAMVLFQSLTVSNLSDGPVTAILRLRHQREFPLKYEPEIIRSNLHGSVVLTERGTGQVLLTLDGDSSAALTNVSSRSGFLQVDEGKHREIKTAIGWLATKLELPPQAARRLIAKMPNPIPDQPAREKLLALNYDDAKQQTLQFWSAYLARGAQFRVPETRVNDLVRANLWHALRLPRRHGSGGPKLAMDLPYSNIGYGQDGTPWPINQSVYVDYMIYLLRGYPQIAAEELAIIYRNNQQSNGRVGGYASWGSYTPSMIFSVAKLYQLSRDRTLLDPLLPATMKSLDWCLNQIAEATTNQTGFSKGLIKLPFNDNTREAGVWSYNQTWFCAALDEWAKVLEMIDHPRAAECRTAAAAYHRAVERAFAHGSMLSPIVQLRDHTWVPFVPTDSETPRRRFDLWYPTDVDGGPTMMLRLRTLDPNGPLTDSILNDHEDNLYAKAWGVVAEPGLNQQATAYLFRDNPKAVLRTFYSFLASDFSHWMLEPTEWRGFGWEQVFCAPANDGAFFDLFRNMLIQEVDDDLVVFRATPRAWLENGKRIEIERAPTLFGPMDITLVSAAAAGELTATLKMAGDRRPKQMWVRFRHPQEKLMKSVTVNGREWKSFDPTKEWVQIEAPRENQYTIVVKY